MKSLEWIKRDERARCRHRETYRMWWIGDRFVVWTIAVNRYMQWDNNDARRCRDCGAWLSLGPSNDKSLAVAIEIKAAQWAIEYDRPSRAGECVPDEVCDLCQARHLADVIREHGDEP